MRNRWFAGAACAGMAAMLLVSAGCANNPGDTANLNQRYAPVKVKTAEQTKASNVAQRSVISVRGIHNTGYVALSDLASAAGYTGKWLKDGSYGIGDHDPRWKFRTGESQALKDGKIHGMPAPAVKENNQLYVPVSGLPGLFGNELTIRTNGASMSLLPRAFGHEAGAGGAGLPFADATGSATRGGGSNASAGQDGRLRIASADSDASDIIQKAKRYLGVKYDFGTGDYSQTGTFDCSSFVRFLFADKGIDLPRTARAQGEQGTSVNKDNLKPGDLLFFYVPGRFKTDKTVGHVGIYMGDGNMIHSSPKPEDGVQITNINKPYWQETFLFAKRLL